MTVAWYFRLSAVATAIYGQSNLTVAKCGRSRPAADSTRLLRVRPMESISCLSLHKAACLKYTGSTLTDVKLSNLLSTQARCHLRSHPTASGSFTTMSLTISCGKSQLTVALL